MLLARLDGLLYDDAAGNVCGFLQMEYGIDPVDRYFVEPAVENLRIKTESGVDTYSERVIEMNTLTILRAVVALSVAAIPCFSQKPPAAELDFDIRATDRAASAGLFPSPDEIKSRQVRAEFGAVDGGLTVTLNSFGWPKVLRRVGGSLSKSSQQEPVLAARDFLAAHPALAPSSAGDLRETSIHRWQGLTQVRLQQFVGDLPVFGGQVTVTLSEDGDIVQVAAGELISSPEIDPTVMLGEVAAIVAATSAAGLGSSESVEQAASSSPNWAFFRDSARPSAEIALQMVAFPISRTKAVPAFRVLIDGVGDHSYEIFIDAGTGSLLFRHSLTQSMGEARVWRRSPIHGDRELVAFPDGWLPPNSMVTTGNNVDAFRDINLDNEPDTDELPNVQDGRAFSETQSFDFDAGEGSTQQSSLEFVAAGITNVFYYVNQAHGYFYELGFTEDAGNFQADNFGNGGVGGDPVLATTHSGFSASFLVRPEGVSPRLRTGLVPDTTFFDFSDNRDLAYDAQTVIHEYAHGVTNRLLGGPGRIDCLVNSHGGALSEGWSDYFGISFTNDPVLGAYGEDDLERGIRRQSYEGYTFTFEDFFNESSGRHNNGEIWAAALWDLRTTLGQEVTDQLVVDALKLTPCRATIPEAKESIVFADQQTNGGANAAAIHEVFGRHGLGFSSSGLDGTSLGDSITFNAAFDLPPADGGNRSPVIAGRINQAAEYRQQLTYLIRALDPDADPLTFTLLEGPDGMTVSPEGEVSWMASRFTRQRARVEITDGQGGRVVHGFTIPVIARPAANQPITVSANQGETGLVGFVVPQGQDLLQVTLRDGSAGGDADLRVFEPGQPSVFSARRGSSETLSFATPVGAVWFAQVRADQGFEDVSFEFSFPEAVALEPNAAVHGLTGLTSSQDFYRLTIPEGVDSFAISTGGGPGDLDVYLAQGRYPICQFSRSVSQACDFDSASEDFGNFESITITGDAALKREAVLQAAAGDYFISLAGAASYSDVSLTVSLDTGAGRPEISPGGVVNAANFGFLVSPGGIGSIFGTALSNGSAEATTTPLPRTLGGSRVLVNGVEAPLFFVSEGQINFQAPFETSVDALASVAVETNGVPSAIDALFPIPNAPEIFTYARTPDAQDPVIVHAGGSLVTPENPARPGETVVIFATGLSGLNNRPATGEASPSSPLATLTRTAIVEIGGQEATTTFAGLVPGFVGLAQFNVELPGDLATAAATQPLVIRIQRFESEPVGLHTGP